MSLKILLLTVAFLFAFGCSHLPTKKGDLQSGIASWYGKDHHGKLTANGERFDMKKMTAAHRTLPMNSIVRVKNLSNGQSVDVRINDRGPLAKDRIIDLSFEAARRLGMINQGMIEVDLEVLSTPADPRSAL